MDFLDGLFEALDAALTQLQGVGLIVVAGVALYAFHRLTSRLFGMLSSAGSAVSGFFKGLFGGIAGFFKWVGKVIETRSANRANRPYKDKDGFQLFPGVDTQAGVGARLFVIGSIVGIPTFAAVMYIIKTLS